jgi:hypothetical protein
MLDVDWGYAAAPPQQVSMAVMFLWVMEIYNTFNLSKISQSPFFAKYSQCIKERREK